MGKTCYICKKELHVLTFIHEFHEFNTPPQGMQEDDVLCNDCTNNYRKENNENQTKMWYLAPIILGIVGGLLMFVALRKENYRMAAKGLKISIILLGIEIVVIFWSYWFGVSLF